MFETFFKEKLGPLALRLALGLACFYHGYLKIMAGGGTSWQPGLATGWQLAIAWGEFAAGLAIVLGFYCRLASVVVLAITAGSLFWWQGWNVFHMPLKTLEPFVMFLLVSLALLFFGAGEISLDGRAGGGEGKGMKKKLAA